MESLKNPHSNLVLGSITMSFNEDDGAGVIHNQPDRPTLRPASVTRNMLKVWNLTWIYEAISSG
jgi:hypothetical protein